jgi:hypothetical protein
MRAAGREVRRPRAVDQLRAFGEIRVVEHLGRRDVHRARVGDVAIDVRERELHRLDLQMLRIGRIDGPVGHAHVLRDAERDQRGDALPVRRNLVDRMATEALADRLDPFRPVRAQVGLGQRAAAFARERREPRGERAFVERARPVVGERAQRLRMVRQAHALADERRAPARHEGLGEARQRVQLGHGGRPFVRDDRRHRIAALRVLDRRFEQIGERQRAELRVQRFPAGDHARHRDGVPAARRLLGDAVRILAVTPAEVVGIPRRRRDARRVQPGQPLAVPYERERVAAEPARHRLNHRDRGRGGQRRIDGVAALPPHPQPASGYDVDTTLRANTGMRVVGYGLCQSKPVMSVPPRWKLG